MDDAKLLQLIRDKILNVTTNTSSDLDNAVYLQQIRDAILGVTQDNSRYGNLDEAIYLQQIRDAILGVTIDNSKYGSLDNAIYLQQIRDAYNGIAARVQGGLDDDIYLAEILGVATGGDTTAPTVSITSTASNPTPTLPIPIAFTLSEVATDFAVGDLTLNGCTVANFAGSGTAYTCEATPTTPNGTMTIDIAANAFHDAAGNGNTAATQFSITSNAYILVDNFTTDDAAPLTSPRTCEPGPGTLAFTDTQNRGSIASGVLVVGTGGGSAAFKAVYDHGSAFTLPVGVLADIWSVNPYALISLVDANAVTSNPGLWRNGSNAIEFWLNSNGFAPYGCSTAAGTAVRLCLVRFSTYVVALVKDGSMGNGNPFRIIGVQNTGLATPRYAIASPYVLGNGLFNSDNYRVFKVPAADLFSTSQTNIADNETFTATANCAFTFTHIAQNGVTQDIMFRRTDDNNCLLLRINQATGDSRMYKKVTGTETAIGTNKTTTVVAGNSYSVSISAIGTRVSYSFNGQSDVATESANQSATGIKFSHVAAALKICPEFCASAHINTMA